MVFKNPSKWHVLEATGDPERAAVEGPLEDGLSPRCSTLPGQRSPCQSATVPIEQSKSSKQGWVASHTFQIELFNSCYSKLNKLQTSSNHSNNNQTKNWREREQKETSRQRRDRETEKEKERRTEVKNSGMKVKMEWYDENEMGTGQSSRAAETQHVVRRRRKEGREGNKILQAEKQPNEEDEEWELPSDNSKEPNFVYRADRKDAPNRANEDRGEHQRYRSALLKTF